MQPQNTTQKKEVTEFKPRDIVYSPGRRSTFILQSRELSGSQWYCYLADPITHKPILQKKPGSSHLSLDEPISCYAWEYQFALASRLSIDT